MTNATDPLDPKDPDSTGTANDPCDAHRKIAEKTTLASVAESDGLGPWLAGQWRILADIDPELLAQIEW